LPLSLSPAEGHFDVGQGKEKRSTEDDQGKKNGSLGRVTSSLQKTIKNFSRLALGGIWGIAGPSNREIMIRRGGRSSLNQ